MDTLFGELRQMMQAGSFEQGSARFDAWHKLLQTAQAQDPARYAEEWVGYLAGFALPEMTFTEWEPVKAWAGLLPGLARISLQLSTSELTDDFVAKYIHDSSWLCVHTLGLYLYDLSVSGFADLWQSPMLSRVTSLELFMGEEDSVPWMNALATSGNLAHLTSLDLSDCELFSEDLEPLWSSPYLGSIKNLNLCWNDLDDQGLTSMARAALPSLESLDLAINQIGDPGVSSLVQAPWFGQLKSLDLGSNEISGQGVEMLSSSDSALEKLILEDNALDLHAIEQLVGSSLRQQLRDLGLSRSGLNQNMLAALCAQSWPNLNQLILSHCAIDVQSLQSIVGGQVFPALNKLTLSACELDAQSLLATQNAPGWAGLSTLGISYNPLQPEGVKVLSMLPLDNLTTLYLNGCQVGFEGAQALAESNWIGNNWVDFNVYEGNITDKGLELLLAKFNAATLKSLDLSLNQLTDQGAKVLAQAAMPQLSKLYLGANEIEEEGALALTVSSTLAHGTKIDISENACAAWDLIVGHPMTYYDSWE